MSQDTKEDSSMSKSSIDGNNDLHENLIVPADINLLDLLIALGREKMTLVVVTLGAAILGVVYSLLTQPIYLARTTIMPTQQSSGAGAGLASLGNLAGLAGMGGIASISGGVKSSDEMFIALMRSQSVQSALIEQFKLKDRYGSKTTEEARQALTQNVAILSDKKSGLIFVDALDVDAEFAAQLANAQVSQLNLILSRLAVTEAQQKRSYFEQQITKTQEKIPQLEMEFKEAQKSSGVEVASLLTDVATLPGQIAAKELQLQVLSRFATSENPEIKRLAGEVAALRSQMDRYQLSKVEARSGEKFKVDQTPEGSRAKAVQRSTLAYNTLKIQEALLDGYVKQLEIAKVEEAKEGPAVQIVDEARAPEVRAKPERKKLVLAFTVTGFFVAFVLAAIKAFMRHMRSSPAGHLRWLELKKAWEFSRG